MTVAAALRGAWRALERAFWPLLCGSIIALVPDVFFLSVRLLSFQTAMQTRVTLAAAMLLARFAASWCLRPGLLAFHAAIVRGEPVSLRALFSHWRSAPAIAVVQLLRGACSFLVGVVVATPMLLVLASGLAARFEGTLVWLTVFVGLAGFGFAWMSLVSADWIVAVEGLAPIDAMKEAYRRTRSFRAKLVLLYLVTWLVEMAGAVVGVMLFGVGLLFTLPATRAFSTAVFTHAYLQMRVKGRELPPRRRPPAVAPVLAPSG